MANRLRDETSPYLLQHADNPVDWWPWGEAAFAAARQADKPVMLSVGYAACHWCHVMAHESFEDEAVAAVMNRLFVNIKVDREERPDVDQVYMAALHALGEQGGWPLTMFLTPAGEPFWGGTYFPKTARYGRPGFTSVLEAVARTFHEEPDRVVHNTGALMRHLSAEAPGGGGPRLSRALLEAAGERLAGVFDRRNGGLRGAPKFPQASLLRFLLVTGGGRWESLVHLTLDRIAQGGIYDHVGGGFARYAVDERWLVPHFEKMLYDNGQLLSLYARAYRRSGYDLFRRRIEETVGWLLRDMRLTGGAFAASLDADTEGEEGATYLWTVAEVDGLLGAAAADFCAAYDVTRGGNFEGRSIPNRLASEPLTDRDDPHADARARLLAARDRRPQPGRDDKILADWNGHAIRGLADAAFALDRPDWRAAAAEAYRFVAGTMADDAGRLAHATRAGRFTRPGFASDHAAMALAAIALHQAGEAGDHLADAGRWLALLDRHYRAADGLYHLAADDAGDLVLNPKPLRDEATPNHHGMIVEASASLHVLTGDPRHRERADTVLAAAETSIGSDLLGAASLLTAFALRLDLPSLVVVGPAGAARDALVRAGAAAHPDALRFVAESTASLAADHPAAGKAPVEGRPAAYVCRSGACGLPVTDPAAFAAAAPAATGGE